MSISRSEYRFLLGLARQLLAERPDIKTAELARQLGVSLRAAYNYRKSAAAGAQGPIDLVAKARAYLLLHPTARAREVGEHLGLGRDAGSHYRQLALDDIARRPAPPPAPAPPAHVYHIPRFLPKKGK